MKVTKDVVVTLAYQVHDPDGQLIDAGDAPMVYLHGGYGNLFERLEDALEGKAVGEQVKVKLQPEDAFGDYDAELVQVEPVDRFPENLAVGMQFEGGIEGAGPEAMQLYRVTDIADGKVVLDANHPLAGMALVFTCTVSELRPALAEEVAHGHVHHPGHHHH